MAKLRSLISAPVMAPRRFPSVETARWNRGEAVRRFRLPQPSVIMATLPRVPRSSEGMYRVPLSPASIQIPERRRKSSEISAWIILPIRLLRKTTGMPIIERIFRMARISFHADPAKSIIARAAGKLARQFLARFLFCDGTNAIFRASNIYKQHIAACFAVIDGLSSLLTQFRHKFLLMYCHNRKRR